MTATQRYDAFMAEMSTAQRKMVEGKQGPLETTAAIESAYARLFPEPVREQIVSRGDRTSLTKLFDAAEMTASNNLDPNRVRDALAAFDAMRRTGGATDKQSSAVRDLMLKTRMFEAHEGVVLPQLVDQSQGQIPTELLVDSASLIRRAIPMTGAQIIVIAHSKCHFSAAAMKAIESDELLAEVFTHHARWLVPQEASAELESVPHGAKPGFQYTLAYNRSEFPMIDSWATPTFYFLDGPRVVEKVVGWPREGRKKELIDAARAIGLLTQ
jgi:hypothetical protein